MRSWIPVIAVALGGCHASDTRAPSDAPAASQRCAAGEAMACRSAGETEQDPNAGLQYYERGCSLGDKPSCRAAADGWRRAGDEAKALDFERRAR